MKKNFKPYEIDASQILGKAKNVFHPKSIQEVKQVIRDNNRISIRGAGTGLMGGCVPENGIDVVLDLSKLDKIGNFDKERKIIEVESGVILDEIQDYLKKYNLEFPIIPLSHDIATIGGMIATNALGNRGLKYGRTERWIRWIEVINYKGDLYRKGTTEISDYSGLEGITGVIVRTCLNLSPIKKRSISIIKINNLKDVIKSVITLKKNEEISSIDFLDKIVSKLIGLEESYHLVVEFENESGDLRDDNYKEFSIKKDSIYLILAINGYTRIEDPKILINKFEELINFTEERNIPIFGQIGIGVFHPCFKENQKKFIIDLIKLTKRLGGNISGAFGIGLLKREYIDQNDKKIWVNIKKRIDPENKFNIGKVI